MPAVFTTQVAINKGLGTSPGSSGGRLGATRPEGVGSVESLIQLENDSGYILLESGASGIALET